MSLKCHKLVLWLSVVVVSGYDVQMKGEVSVILHRPREREAVWRARVGREGRRPAAPTPAQPRLDRVTAAAPPDQDCVYQYPEKKQLNALLSNMMNELTKMFTRVHQLVSDEYQLNRFKVMKKKKLRFFEEVFKNMTAKFRRFYNREMQRVPPPTDVCTNQETIKNLWQDLLDTSLKCLRRAALQTTAEYLRVQHRSDDRDARRKLGRFLEGEMVRARTNHLAMLCDSFQLCYGDLV